MRRHRRGAVCAASAQGRGRARWRWLRWGLRWASGRRARWHRRGAVCAASTQGGGRAKWQWLWGACACRRYKISEVDVAIGTSTRLMSQISEVDVAIETSTRLMSQISEVDGRCRIPCVPGSPTTAGGGHRFVHRHCEVLSTSHDLHTAPKPHALRLVHACSRNRATASRCPHPHQRHSARPPHRAEAARTSPRPCLPSDHPPRDRELELPPRTASLTPESKARAPRSRPLLSRRTPTPP